MTMTTTECEFCNSMSFGPAVSKARTNIMSTVVWMKNIVCSAIQCPMAETVPMALECSPSWQWVEQVRILRLGFDRQRVLQ